MPTLLLIFAISFSLNNPYKSESLHITGEINEAALEKVQSADLDALKTLIIRSSGGNEIIGAKIGEIIRNNNISVVVDGYCMSACAQYILPAASHAHTTPGSFVAFHVSISAIPDITNRPLGPMGAESIEHIRGYYSRYGFSERILTDSLVATAPHCLILNTSGAQSMMSNYAFWIPPTSYLRDVGIKFSGQEINSLEEAQKYVSRWVKPEISWVYGAPPKNIDDLYTSLEFPECD